MFTSKFLCCTLDCVRNKAKTIEFIRDPDVTNRYQTIGIVLITAGLGVGVLPIIDSEAAETTSMVGASIMLLLGLIIFFVRTKVQLDPEKYTARTHNHLFGIRLGKWESLEPFQFISIKAKRVGYNNHRGMRSELTETRFEVILLSKSKRNRYLLVTTENEAHARHILNLVEDAFKFDIA